MEKLTNALIGLVGLGVVALTCAAGMAVGHGGGLDADGCHNDYKNCGYHCHR